MTPKEKSADTRDQSKQDAKVDAGHIASSASPEVKPLIKAYFEWLETVNAAWAHYRETCGIAFAEMMQVQSDIQQEAWAPVREAYEKMQQAARTACMDKEAWLKWLEAQQAYFRAQADFQTNEKVHEVCAKAHERFIKTQEEAFNTARQRQHDAHTKYVAALQVAWAGLNPETVTGATLGTAAWATQGAAWSAPRA